MSGRAPVLVEVRASQRRVIIKLITKVPVSRARTSLETLPATRRVKLSSWTSCVTTSMMRTAFWFEEAPKIYEMGSTMEELRARCNDEFLKGYNDTFSSRRLDIILFDDAMRHFDAYLSLHWNAQGFHLIGWRGR